MNFSLSPQLAVLIITVLINLWLAFIVSKNGFKDKINSVFVLLNVVIAVWSVAMFYSSSVGFFVWDKLMWTKLTVFLATPMTLLFFLLAYALTHNSSLPKRNLTIIYLIATGVVMANSLSPYTFVSITNDSVVVGPGILLFSLFTTLASLGAIYQLYKKFISSQGIERQRLSLILAGVFLMVFLIIFTILLPLIIYKNHFFVSFASLYVILFLVPTTVAILRYSLFNIKIVATEALVILLMLTLMIEGGLSGSNLVIVYKSIFAIFVGMIGILLVGSVKKEIKQRMELESLSTELTKANLRLQELDKQKTEFLSIASHQLRTPLSILKGYIELIKDGGYGKVTKDTVKILGNMDDSNEHLIKLVDEFLNISRIEQGRAKYNLADFDLTHMVEGVVVELSKRAEDKGLKLKWTEKKPHHLTGDEEKIRHVAFNFVDNAIKYTEKGDVAVVLKADVGGIKLAVSDHGFGFGTVDEANFFQKFYRGENVKNTNVTGTGLGLFVCKKFIEAHGGKVWAHSQGLGKGSEFGFWLPLTPPVTISGNV